MGNRQSQHELKRKNTKIPAILEAISQSSIQLFLSQVHKLPFSMTVKQFENINHELIERDYESGNIVIREGEPAAGIFVIITGCCKVMSSNSKAVICHLSKQDIFGEISSIYLLPVTCTVICEENCKFVCLPAKFIQNVHKNQIDPMKDWLIMQCYLDTACLFNVNVITHSFVQRAFLNTALFSHWSSDAMLDVFKLLPRSIIELYYPGSFICHHGNTLTCAYILIKGEVNIINGTKNILLSTYKYGNIIFCEESLFCNTLCPYSISASRVSMIVTVYPSSFEKALLNHSVESSILLSYSKKWSNHIQSRDQSIYAMHYDVMNMNAVCWVLKQSNVFFAAPWNFLSHIFLAMKFKNFKKGEDFKFQKDDILVVMVGTIKVFYNSQAHFDLQKNDLTLFDSSYDYFVTSIFLLLGYFSIADVDAARNFYPDVKIELRKLLANNISIKTKEPCKI